MTLPAGARLGPYEILSPLASGGMGEVYRARDTRLDRVLAVKILPADVAGDPERLRRFDREARAASALNHPNIVAVYDVGASDSISYLAMELIDGRTLQSLLRGGPLPIRRVLEIAAQAAAGLASAHEAGIVHRDVKPANLVVSKEGHVKIVDFGLAKVVRPGLEAVPDSRVTAATTRPGALLGTIDYMSPEQAAGESVDFRCDQFSLGIVLYEMATGKSPFHRASGPETLRAIREEHPAPLSRVRADAPPPLSWIVERCLAKEPGERFLSTRDLARDLQSLREHLPELEAASPGGDNGRLRPRLVRWTAAIAGIVALGVAVYLSRRTPPGEPVRFIISPPPGAYFTSATTTPAPAALSPDGRQIVFGVREPSGRQVLYLRSLKETDARPVEGTAGATYPFWSLDSRHVGFFADGQLRRIAISGGPAQTVCAAPDGRGGTWNGHGVIVFAPHREGPLHHVSAGGGASVAVTALGPSSPPNLSHRWPHFLPDGRRFLYFAGISRTSEVGHGIYLGSLDAGEGRLLLRELSNAAYAAPGYLLFVREGTLLAAPFDLRKGEVRGPPIPVAGGLHQHPYRLNADFTVSAGGVLAYQAAAPAAAAELVWVDRAGHRLGVLGEPRAYNGLRLSPDGRHCAVEIRDERAETVDIWIFDVERRIASRLTSGAPINDTPVWSPDGARVAFASNRKGRWDLYERSSLGAGDERVLLESAADKAPTDWARDGRWIAFTQGGNRGAALWVFDVVERRAKALTPTTFNERDGRFSPDVRWLAYSSDESGMPEVYVRSFPSLSAKWRISRGGGSQPAWRSDGRELFYLAPDNSMMAVPVDAAQSFDAGTPRRLFPVPRVVSASDIPLYDVSPDGRRFLVTAPMGERPSPALVVALNWLMSPDAR